MNIEAEIFNIISRGGDAKSIAYEALKMAQKGDFKKADETLQEANDSLTKAHNTQTKLIQAEINGDKTEMSLLMVHAQDHLMAAISEMSLIEEMIKMSKRIADLETKGQ